MKTWLADTGALVAYLDGDDPAHRDVAACLDGFRGRLATTTAVVTESMHLVGAVRGGPRSLTEFLAATRTRVVDLAQPPELTLAVDLMERYENVPMDYADATLVLLAEALAVRDVLTLDRRGFSTFRTRAGKSFRLVLDG